MKKRKSNKKPSVCTVNMPDAKLKREPHTTKELEQDTKNRISRISKEFAKGFSFIKEHPKSVTFFGSARLKPSSPYYKKAQHIAKKLSEEGFAIATGGGPGIMEAANRGACEASGHSLGFNIRLPFEQVTNPYVNESVDFY